MKNQAKQCSSMTQERAMRRNKMENCKEVVTTLLRELSMPVSLKGYSYIRHAIELIIQDENNMYQLTKVLYPTVAKKFATTPARVERAIRHAIEITWYREAVGLSKLFPYTHTVLSKPTNGEFIATLADHITTYGGKL